MRTMLLNRSFDFCYVYRCLVDQHSIGIEGLLNNIQKRWGSAALQPLRALAARPVLPGLSTGYDLLDAVLGAGGIPRGQTTELLGKPTSGMTTLAYHIVASANQQNQYAIYVDLESAFDPDYAVQCGINLNQLFLVRPETEVDALDIARDLIEKGDVGVIALDFGQTLPQVHHIRRLTTSLLHSGCVVLHMLSLKEGMKPQTVLSGSAAALRLLVERDTWLTQHSDIRGYRSQVIVFGRHTASGKRVSIDIEI